jgi:hypothetical protein
MPPGNSERADRLARATLLVAMAASAATILILGRGLWFWADEVDWLVAGDDFGLRSLLTPHASHLIAIPRIIYEGIPRVFGVDYLPFRILALACLLACAAQAFVLIRRRVGSLPAVAGAIVLLFFGSAEEIVLSPIGIPFVLSIALGLAALLAVERRDLRGDVGAMALLALAILSHTFGTIVAVGVAVYYACDRGRRRELWVPLVPILLWIAWWLWARQFDQGITSSGNLFGAPWFIVESAGAAVEAVLGLRPLLDGRLDFLFGLVAIGALAWRFARGGVGPWLYSYVTTATAFWFGIALAESTQREATTPRYLLFGAIMVMLIAAESLRGAKLDRRATLILAAVFAISMAGNVGRLVRSSEFLDGRADEVRAQVGVQELDGEWIDPAFVSGRLGPPATSPQPASAGELLAFGEDVGPLGFTAAELLRQSEEVRLGADFVLVRGLGIATAEVPAKGGPKPVDCFVRRPGSDGYTTFEFAPGLNLVALEHDTGAVGATLDLGRFADLPDVEIGSLRPGRTNAVLLPDDGVDQPWLARTTGTVRVCRAAGAR